MTARNHHFISQSYLAQFTDNGRNDGKLHVFPVGGEAPFQTIPRNVGAQRDFNRIDMPGYSHDALESAMGAFEGQACDAIRRVISGGAFPDECDLNLILNLLCLFAIRNPGMRGAFNAAKATLMRHVAELSFRNRKTWDAYVETAARKGDPVPGSVTFDDVKAFVDRGEYDLEFTTGSSLRTELRVFDDLLPILGRRTWSLLMAPAASLGFVTCDHPVTLRWIDSTSGPAGYGLRGTEVFLPLSPSYALYGTFEGQDELISLSHEAVAMVNGYVARNALRQVYARSDEFAVHDGYEVISVKRHPFTDSLELQRDAAPRFVVLPPHDEPQT